jgi:hypothetical protein
MGTMCNVTMVGRLKFVPKFHVSTTGELYCEMYLYTYRQYANSRQSKANKTAFKCNEIIVCCKGYVAEGLRKFNITDKEYVFVSGYIDTIGSSNGGYMRTRILAHTAMPVANTRRRIKGSLGDPLQPWEIEPIPQRIAGDSDSQEQEMEDEIEAQENSKKEEAVSAS